MCHVVELNVGGRLFQSYRTTLEASSHLKILLSSDLEDDTVDADGRLFIDRDPELFEQVLKLLRGYRFRNRAGLSWDEVKEEADFYQVPGLENFAPEKPVVVVVPEETTAILQVSLRSMVSKRGRQHYVICHDDVDNLPADLASQVYQCAPYPSCPLCLSIDGVIAAGFVLKEPVNSVDDNDENTWTYECKERVVFYAKTPGTLLEVPKLRNEVLREDCPHWIRITCRSQVSE